MNQIANRQQTAPQQRDLREELTSMADQFARALDGQVNPDRFLRVVLTAVFSDPDLLKADRKSLFEAAMRAAQDQLLPDKREGAFVVFKTKMKIDGQDRWIDAVQWMPMIGGIVKKIHQSGDIKFLTARVVYGGDTYRTWIDDEGEHVQYEPADEPDFDAVRQVFAMAKAKDGSVYVEPLSTRDIEKIRSASRSSNGGPWSKWWEEMAKKSAIRRLSKRLNLSPEVHDILQRDNAFYDLAQVQDQRPTGVARLTAARQAQNTKPEQVEGFSLQHVNNATAQATGHQPLQGYDDSTPARDLKPVEDSPLQVEADDPAVDDNTPVQDSAADPLTAFKAELAKAKTIEAVDQVRANYAAGLNQLRPEDKKQARLAISQRKEQIEAAA